MFVSHTHTRDARSDRGWDGVSVGRNRLFTASTRMGWASTTTRCSPSLRTKHAGPGLHTHRAERPLSEMGGFTTLVGILVHSAADGIALGAAAFAENAATGALISLAIILHKVRTRLRRHTTILPS